MPMMVPYCAFCQTAGFAGPHDHFVRASRKPGAAVTCPRLLATTCTFCNKNGHTAKYCGERQDAERLAKKAASDAKKVATARGEWTTPARVAARPKMMTMSRSPAHTPCGFATLNIESSDSEQDCDEPLIDQPVTVPTGPTWADVAKRDPVVEQIKIYKRPAGTSWADWDDDE